MFIRHISMFLPLRHPVVSYICAIITNLIAFFLLINALLSSRHITCKFNVSFIIIVWLQRKTEECNNAVFGNDSTATAYVGNRNSLQSWTCFKIQWNFQARPPQMMTFLRGSAAVVSDVCTFLARNVETKKTSLNWNPLKQQEFY